MTSYAGIVFSDEVVAFRNTDLFSHRSRRHRRHWASGHGWRFGSGGGIGVFFCTFLVASNQNESEENTQHQGELFEHLELLSDLTADCRTISRIEKRGNDTN